MATGDVLPEALPDVLVDAKGSDHSEIINLGQRTLMASHMPRDKKWQIVLTVFFSDHGLLCYYCLLLFVLLSVCMMTVCF